MYRRNTLRLSFYLSCALALNAPAASEYFVSVGGDDSADGRSWQSAFATVQQGVNALAAGDTLTIGPGEYFGSAQREGLGDADRWTTIRAHIPGTTLIRGDIPAPEFKAVDGFEHVYAAPFDGDVQAVLEWDTYTRMMPAPNFSELEYLPGSYFHDAEEQRLYISTGDFSPPAGRTYSVSIVPYSGLTLVQPTQVRIEGLAFTGFNLSYEKRHSDQHGGVWGLWLQSPTRCVVSDTVAYLNTGGIGINSRDGGNTVVEGCLLYGNSSPFSGLGGVAIYHANDDVIRQSIAFQGNRNAFRFYQGGEGSALIEDCIAAEGWVQMKGGAPLRDHGVISRSVSAGPAETYLNFNSIVGGGNRHRANAKLDGTIHLADKPDLIAEDEFADPLNLDFRLQATSRFRGATADGSDKGLQPFAADVFFVSPDGDDNHDGLSTAQPWRSLDTALKRLRPGDTLYLMDGKYSVSTTVSINSSADTPVKILGRGDDSVIISGALTIANSSHVNLRRLQFSDTLFITDSDSISIRDCTFQGVGTAIAARSTTGPRITHCIFVSSTAPALTFDNCSQVFLSSNLMPATKQPAVAVDTLASIRYSDYNNYPATTGGWLIDGTPTAVSDLPGLERYHRTITPVMSSRNSRLQLDNSDAFASAGLLATAIGPHRYDRSIAETIAPPRVHSVSATTANIEWTSNRAAQFEIEWGQTPDLGTIERVPVQRFASFSMTGLEPATQYYFRINSGRTVHPRTSGMESVDIDLGKGGKILSFTTKAVDAPPRTFFVSPDGSNTNDGLSAESPLQTIDHAASLVNVGDTVLIMEGHYPEQIRIRATGTPVAPIRFQGIDEQRVVITGGDKELKTVFVILFKDSIEIDHLHFEDMNNTGPFWPGVRGSGVITAISSPNLTISRCLYDGRGGYSPTFLGASQCPNMTLRNSVMLSSMGGALQVTNCPDFVYEHNILLRPMILGLWLENRSNDWIQVRNSIFTDNMPSKAFVPLIRFNRGLTVEDNNAFSLRTEERNPIGTIYAEMRPPPDEPEWQPQPSIRESANFRIMRQLGDIEAFMQPREGRAPNVPEDMIMLGANQNITLTFEHFIPDNPLFHKRRIGLQPEAFPWLDFTPKD